MRNKNGFTIVEVVIFIAVLAIIGALGYTAYNNLVANHDSTATDASASPAPTATPVVVKSSSDLEKISSELDAMSLEDSDSNSQLDTAASSF